MRKRNKQGLKFDLLIGITFSMIEVVLSYLVFKDPLTAFEVFKDFTVATLASFLLRNTIKFLGLRMHV